MVFQRFFQVFEKVSRIIIKFKKEGNELTRKEKKKKKNAYSLETKKCFQKLFINFKNIPKFLEMFVFSSDAHKFEKCLHFKRYSEV